MTDVLAEAVAKAEAELAAERSASEQRYAWLASYDGAYDGVDVYGMFSTVEKARQCCVNRSPDEITAWFPGTYEEGGKTVYYEVSSKGMTSYVVTKMEIQ